MSSKLVHFLYVLTIGLLFAAFIGFGVATFYKAPQFPEAPVEIRFQGPDKDDPSSLAMQEKYDAEQKDFQKAMSRYNLNLSIALISVAVVVLAVSLLGLERVEVIGDGLTLGGVFTLLYGLGRAMAVDIEIFRFITVTVGLVVILLLAYWKFVRKPKEVLSV